MVNSGSIITQKTADCSLKEQCVTFIKSSRKSEIIQLGAQKGKTYLTEETNMIDAHRETTYV
jgi:hypothetical protein